MRHTLEYNIQGCGVELLFHVPSDEFDLKRCQFPNLPQDFPTHSLELLQNPLIAEGEMGV